LIKAATAMLRFPQAEILPLIPFIQGSLQPFVLAIV